MGDKDCPQVLPVTPEPRVSLGNPFVILAQATVHWTRAGHQIQEGPSCLWG